MSEPEHRWPRRVYSVGNDPDARFSLANERTYLAWLRTSLAFVAAGMALEALGVPAHEPVRSVLVAVVVILGSVTAVLSFLRWAATERALRQDRPLPPPRLAAVMSVVLAIGALVLIVTILLE